MLVSGWRWSPSWLGKNAARETAAAIMEGVGLSAEDLYRRPIDFSGGQRQRISIAQDLLMEPWVLICDEVVSARELYRSAAQPYTRLLFESAGREAADVLA